jgi:hypothetical protein
MLVDLINQSNPSLPVPVTKTNLKYGTPTAVNGAAATANPNTTILVTGAANSPYIGKQTLGYRRIDLGTLFRNQLPVISKYSAAATGVVPYKISDLLADINQVLGLSLTTDDFTDASFPAASDNYYGDGTRTSKVNLVAKATSLAYQGSFSLRWHQAPQVLANVLTVPSLENALIFPSGDLVDANPQANGKPYVIDLDAYWFDWTDVMTGISTASPQTPANGAGVTASATAGSLGDTTAQGKGWIAIANQLRVNNTNAPYYVTSSDTDKTKYGNMYGWSAAVIDLTTVANQAAYPEANFKYYNRMIVLTPNAGSTWAAGKQYLHFNV